MKGIDVIARQKYLCKVLKKKKKKKKKGKRCDKAVLCDHFDNYILDSYLYHIHVIN